MVADAKAKTRKRAEVDPLAGDEKQLRGKLSKLVKQEREVAKLEKRRNDKKIELTAANKAFEKGQLMLREMITGVPQAEMDFEDDDQKPEGE